MEEEIKKYRKDTAGSIMTTKVPVVFNNDSIGTIVDLLTKYSSQFDSINYVYVLNGRKKLAGVLSIKELFRQKKRVKVKDVMVDELVVVRVNTDQEKVVYKALKYNIKALPVVDKNGFFLGLVQSDDILRVLKKETEEDLFQMAGVVNKKGSFDNILNISVFKSVSHRFPWLFVGILGGLLIARIIGIFEETIYDNIVLIMFIPLVTYIASAVSTQMSTFMIRDLAVNGNFLFFRYFFKNFLIVISIAVMSGLSFFLIDMFFYGDIKTGIILSVAIFSAILSSLFSGLFVPFSLSRAGIDPANASGPFGTILQDTLSILIYFSVISLML